MRVETEYELETSLMDSSGVLWLGSPEREESVLKIEGRDMGVCRGKALSILRQRVSFAGFCKNFSNAGGRNALLNMVKGYCAFLWIRSCGLQAQGGDALC